MNKYDQQITEFLANSQVIELLALHKVNSCKLKQLKEKINMMFAVPFFYHAPYFREKWLEERMVELSLIEAGEVISDPQFFYEADQSSENVKAYYKDCDRIIKDHDLPNVLKIEKELINIENQIISIFEKNTGVDPSLDLEVRKEFLSSLGIEKIKPYQEEFMKNSKLTFAINKFDNRDVKFTRSPSSEEENLCFICSKLN